MENAVDINTATVAESYSFSILEQSLIQIVICHCFLPLSRKKNTSTYERVKEISKHSCEVHNTSPLEPNAVGTSTVLHSAGTAYASLFPPNN
jgi:hypothetical protein